MVLANFTTGLIVRFCRIAKSSIGVAVSKVRHCKFDTVNSLLSSQDFLYFVKDTHPLRIFPMSFQDRVWLFSGTTQFEMAWHHEIWLKFSKACILQTEDHLAALLSGTSLSLSLVYSENCEQCQEHNLDCNGLAFFRRKKQATKAYAYALDGESRGVAACPTMEIMWFFGQNSSWFG